MKAKTKFFIAFSCLFYLSLMGNTQDFQAIPDTIYLTPGIPDTVDLMANDIIPPGDSIYIAGVYISPVYPYILPPEELVSFFVEWTQLTRGMVQGHYVLRRKGTPDISQAILTCYIHDESYDSLYLNKVNARFMACGYHYTFGNTCFEVPRGSGKGTIFNHSLWIGGIDESDQVHFSGFQVHQGPGPGPSFIKDYWAGPIMDSTYYSKYTDTLWNYVWNLRKEEIEYHKRHWKDPNYKPIHDILTWPGNGDTSMGQAARLAPYIDIDQDGIYNPFQGDYPNIRGDQGLFFIFNDERDEHLNSWWGPNLRIEIQGMAYAFDIHEDSAFNNTVFVNYRITNYSTHTFSETFTGIRADMDIGDYRDDYIGCDVEKGMFFGYNGTPIDGNGEPFAYGANPPVQAIVFLGGPILPSDSRDNPEYLSGDCNVLTSGFPIDQYAINGCRFGDGIVDNERMGMTRFIYFNNLNAGIPGYMADPNNALECYLTLQGIWLDSTNMIYGGNGHSSIGGYGPECHFAFPGLSDVCNWGTNGIAPYGPKLWTEKVAGNNPNDRKGLGSLGPYTLSPGETIEMDLAYIFARDYINPDTNASFEVLNQYVNEIRESFRTNVLPNGQPFLSISENPLEKTWTLTIYPNPASSFITLTSNQGFPESATCRMLNFKGITVLYQPIPDGAKTIQWNVSGFPAGLYFIIVQSKDNMVTKKITIIR